MILRTFAALTNIGLRKEQNLWNNGIIDFLQFLEYGRQSYSETWSKYWNQEMQEIKDLILANDMQALLLKLPNKLHYRLLPHIQTELVFFDAEMIVTNDLKEIFMATCLFKNKIYSFTQGKNLKELKEFLNDKHYIVTFGGTKNDLPLLYQAYKEKPFLLHVDLKNLTNQVKLKGGLKSIESQLHIVREQCKDLNGADAPILWQKYLQSKDQKILQNLLHYNAEDTIHQPHILKHCWEHLLPPQFIDLQDCQLEFHKPQNPHPFHREIQI